MKEHGSIERIIENIKDKKRIPPGLEEQYIEARKQFKQPEVTPEDQMIDFKVQGSDMLCAVNYLASTQANR